MDKLAHVREEESGLSEKKFEIKIKEKVIYSILGLFFIFTFILFLKTSYLQIFEGKKLRNVAENNKGKISLIRPERGIIYDKNYKKIVLNSPAYDLVCDTKNFSNPNSPSKEVEILSQILGETFSDIKDKITKSEDFEILLAENLNHETLLILEARIGDLPDCKVEKNTIRNYVTGPIFSHVLGYNGRISRSELENVANYAINDYIGKDGLEKFYEKELRGIPGRTEVIRSAQGIKRGDNVLSLPKDGYNLVLNIDADLQEQAYNSLKRSIENIGAKKGAAVALDPRSGAVLAMVSYPSYDNNIFSGGISKKDFNELQNNTNQPFFNRAVLAQYPTGSTIKPFVASGALQEKIISPEKQINDQGYILVHSRYDPSVVYKFTGVKPHGLVDMRKAIAVSSNIYFYTVGGGYGEQKGLGPSAIKKYLHLFGWEEETGIDLPREFSGFVPSPDWKSQAKKEPWWDGDTYNLSIGQSDLQVTPLQVAAAYSAIANGGKLYKPQITQRITEGSGQSASIIKEFKPEITRENFIDPENLQIVKEGMRDCVQKSYGSCFMLSTLPVPIAGKTGTTETGKQGRYNTWVSTFAPYDNPEIVFVATIEEVEGLRAATLPMAHDVLQYYFNNRK